ncbi:Translation protein, beta-barrel domain [Pseudocohnilembus persalinus]|uniref:Translation protein, beta-barrel domain n=1 Tax=Pseudocohnilembus persalinus TaxID=266149 RepID=A0A0V0QZ41_PSEPJ|nr:Translation protein, beta-barrel domain [Pseudocohnilembus persalinus]|eukprot:KRX07609.1 Translation protein, beta-barrel domain [Pseudocohnilembus persalinus]
MAKEVVQKDTKVGKVTGRKSTMPVRLYAKAAFVGYRRGKHTQNSNQALLRVQGVEENQAARYYLGKRVAYVYQAKNTKLNTKYRAIWGRITKIHGNNGTVVGRFSSNLPPRAMGSILRVMLYPNRDQQ